MRRFLDRLQAIQIYVRVVEAGGFTRAAESLRVPRSTVSTVVQRLESHLGVRLIQRTTRRMQLTTEGAAYYEWCLRLIVELDEGENLFAQGANNVRGPLRIDVPSRIARLIIAPALPDFLAQYPQLDFELRSTDRSIDLIEEGVDCVLRVGELQDSRLAARRIGLLRMINLASPAYLERHGIPQTPGDLVRHSVVRYASPTNARIDDWEYLDQGELRSIPMRGAVTVNNAENYIACCIAGLGLVQVPAYDASDHLADGSLVEVLPDWTAPPMPLSALYPHRRHLSPRVSVFLDWIGALFAARLH